MKMRRSSSIRLILLTSSLLIVFISGCSKSAEEMCVEAQMNFYDQAEPNSKQRKYFDTAFKSRDAYYAWACPIRHDDHHGDAQASHAPRRAFPPVIHKTFDNTNHYST